MNEKDKRIILSALRQDLAEEEAQVLTHQAQVVTHQEKAKELRGVIQRVEDGEQAEIQTKSQEYRRDGLLSVVQQEHTLENDAFPYEIIKGMSQTRATIAIARHFGGVIRTKVLAKVLMESGVLKRTKNASSIASRLIVGSERFEKISDGLYRLKIFDPEPVASSNLSRLVARSVQ